MKRMRAGVFKARCLALMDDIQASGEPLVVTKRGKPVVKVILLRWIILIFSDLWPTA